MWLCRKFERLLVKGPKNPFENAWVKTRSIKGRLLQQPVSAQSAGIFDEDSPVQSISEINLATLAG